MATTGRSNLSKNSRGLSAQWFGSNDPMMERDWVRTVNTVREKFMISPAVYAYPKGGTTSFMVDKRADKVGRTKLRFTRNAITNGYADDWEAVQTIDRIQVKNGMKVFYEKTGEQLLDDIRLKWTKERRAAASYGAGGMESVTTRKADAAAPRNFEIDLDVPWSAINRMIRIVAMPQALEFVITWRPLNSFCITTNGGPISGGDITSAVLAVDYYHLMTAAREAIFAQVHSAPLNMKFLAREFQNRYRVPADNSGNPITVTTKLVNIKNDCVVLFGYLRPVASVDNTTGTTLDMITHLKPNNLTYWLSDGGTPFTNTFTQDFYHELGDKADAFPNAARSDGQNYMVASFTMNPDMVRLSEADCYGSRCFITYNSPEFNCKFDGVLSADHYLDLYSDYHNIIIQYKGEIRRWLE